MHKSLRELKIPSIVPGETQPCGIPDSQGSSVITAAQFEEKSRAQPGAISDSATPLPNPRDERRGTHGISDPLGVTFALGGTLVNVLVIYFLLPMLDRAKRGGKALNLQF